MFRSLGTARLEFCFVTWPDTLLQQQNETACAVVD